MTQLASPERAFVPYRLAEDPRRAPDEPADYEARGAAFLASIREGAVVILPNEWSVKVFRPNQLASSLGHISCANFTGTCAEGMYPVAQPAQAEEPGYNLGRDHDIPFHLPNLESILANQDFSDIAFGAARWAFAADQYVEPLPEGEPTNCERYTNAIDKLSDALQLIQYGQGYQAIMPGRSNKEVMELLGPELYADFYLAKAFLPAYDYLRTLAEMANRQVEGEPYTSARIDTLYRELLRAIELNERTASYYYDRVMRIRVREDLHELQAVDEQRLNSELNRVLTDEKLGLSRRR